MECPTKRVKLSPVILFTSRWFLALQMEYHFVENQAQLLHSAVRAKVLNKSFWNSIKNTSKLRLYLPAKVSNRRRREKHILKYFSRSSRPRGCRQRLI